VKSEKTDSGFTLVNDKMIVAKGDNTNGADYSYIDYYITPQVLYFYWLVDVSFSGEYTIHGPVSAIHNHDPIYGLEE